MLMEMAGSRSCRGSVFHEDGPDEQNARGPSVEEVDVRGVLGREEQEELQYFYSNSLQNFRFGSILKVEAVCIWKWNSLS